ncbi:hypothetical protein Ancab_010779 [Ancistrocladus abbreviatus]
MSAGSSKTGEAETGTLGPELEFRAEDQAWDTVRLVLQNEVLIVKYCEFPDVYDERFWAGEFSTLQKIHSFRDRFRPLSCQVQDTECSKVKEGMVVCACSVNGGDRRFYDAIVDAVETLEHSFMKGEECRCTFLLSWIHGPKAGTLASVKIGDICFIESCSVMDPRLTSFLKISKQKLEISSSGMESVDEGCVLNQGSGSHCHSFKRKSSCGLQKREGAGQFTSTKRKIEGNFSDERMEDANLGGGLHLKSNVKQSDGHYFILIENVEKDVSPSRVVNFIDKQISISAEAYVFPSLSSELYTRVALVVDSVEKLEKLWDFLHKPGQMITSSRGRPWIVSSVSKYKPFRAPLGSLELNSLSKNQNIKAEGGDELKVVRSGSEDYNKGKLLRDLFLQFSNHQSRLHGRLKSEEQRILQPS